MGPEIIHTHPMEGHWKFQGGQGSQQPKFIKESMKLNWKFLGGGGGGSNEKNLPWERYIWIFSETIHSPLSEIVKFGSKLGSNNST